MSNNLGILWIAVELTTLASVFLITFHDRDTSLEAAWKFLMLGSLGLGFALLGTVLLFAAGQGHLGEGMAALNWTRFMQVAPYAASVHAAARRGVRADRVRHKGRARADAHVEAGCVSRGAVAGGVADGGRHAERRPLLHPAGPPDFEGGAGTGRSRADLLLTLGLLSVLIATPFILIQWNLKRLLAYSSIEHVGIMAVGVGLGAEAGVVRRAAAHDVSLAGQAGGVLFRRHARAASQLVGLRPDRQRHVHARADRERAVRARGADDHRLAALRSVLQRDDDSQGGIPRSARDGDVDIPRRAGRAVLRLRVSGRAASCSDRRAIPTERRVPQPERFDVGMATAMVAAVMAVVSAFYLPAPLMALIHAATRVVWGAAMTSVASTVSAALGVDEWAVRELRAGEVLLEADAAALPALADRAAQGLDGRLMSLFASDERDGDGPLLRAPCVVAAAAADVSSHRGAGRSGDALISVDRGEVSGGELVRTGGHGFLRPRARGPSEPGARRASRRLAGRRVGAPQGLSRRPRRASRRRGEFHPFRPVTGEGVFQMPVGPVHAGIIEPGHFRFGVAGEPVLYLQLRLFYVHKGTEKRFERLPWRHGVFLAESISGDTSVGHALAYAHAIERLAGVDSAAARARAESGVARARAHVQPHRRHRRRSPPTSRSPCPRVARRRCARVFVRLQDELFGTRLMRGDHCAGRRQARSVAAGARRAARRTSRAFEQRVRRPDHAH